VGLLYVYIGDTDQPVLTTILNLQDAIDLTNGRAYLGFTAATGLNMFQTHDILEWQFSSSHIDQDYFPPTVVNNEGSFECMNASVCVHPTDNVHYMRKNHMVTNLGVDSLV
jgi:hypothetical protein